MEASAAECTWRLKAAKTPLTLNTWAQAQKAQLMLLARESWAPRQCQEQAVAGTGSQGHRTAGAALV